MQETIDNFLPKTQLGEFAMADVGISASEKPH